MQGKSVELPILGSRESYRVQPGKIICLGLNYRDHIKESLSVKVQGVTPDEPSEPVLFPKLPSALAGPGETILLPAIVNTYDFDEPRTDHEGELAIIIGEQCRSVRPGDEMSVVFGYTCMNDVSQRNIQNGDRSGWFRGKSFDTFAPVGPAVLRSEDCPDVQNLDIACRVNGEVKQVSNTRHMIFPVTEIVSFVSRNFTLYPGDLILTGTPSGVGPLVAGDTVEVEIESIGVLRNPVENES